MPPELSRRRRNLCLAAALLPAGLAQANAPGVILPGGLLSVLGASSLRIEGSGKVVDEDRSLAGFSRLIVQAPVDVRLRAASADRVIVHADDNIAPLIDTVLQGGALVIGLRTGAAYRTHTRVRIRVEARQVNAVVLRGSGEVRADRIEAEVFEATLQGSGDIAIDSLQAGAVAVSIAGNGDVRLAGKALTLGAVIEGSGDLHGEKLQAQKVAVRIRGSGDARVHATDELQVEIDGSGDVRYRGSPKISRQVRGSGSVEPIR
jgi:Putative auto-transporter adhesin, head GIN domain